MADAISLARATMRVIHANLCWAFGYNVIALPLAALGYLNPLFAGIAMSASSLIVVANSLRLRGFTPGTPRHSAAPASAPTRPSGPGPMPALSPRASSGPAGRAAARLAGRAGPGCRRAGDLCGRADRPAIRLGRERRRRHPDQGAT